MGCTDTSAEFSHALKAASSPPIKVCACRKDEAGAYCYTTASVVSRKAAPVISAWRKQNRCCPDDMSNLQVTAADAEARAPVRCRRCWLTNPLNAGIQY